MIHETEETEDLPSEAELQEFREWLEFIVKNKDGDIDALCDHLVAAQDWTYRVVEVPARYTQSGHPVIYCF